MRICKQCNIEYTDNIKFCPECGTKLENVRNTCPNCGTEYNEGQKFCSECGNGLTSETASQKTSYLLDEIEEICNKGIELYDNAEDEIAYKKAVQCLKRAAEAGGE